MEIDSIINHFGTKLSVDLMNSMNEALARKNGQQADIRFNQVIERTADGVNIKIVADKEHWIYIEDGRKPGKMPPSEAFGKKWQNKLGINPSNIIYELTVKYKQSKKINTKTKKLTFDKASKSLAFLIARSIGKKGVKPKPFIDRVVNDGRIAKFSKDLADAMGKEIAININK
jgi:hypothetical protein